MVKSALEESSRISSVSAESDAVIFSPAENSPTTFVRFITFCDVPSSKTKPVAPEVTPLI